MAYSFSCKLILTPYVKETGLSQVALQVIIKRRKAQIRTGISVPPGLFDKSSGKIFAGKGMTIKQASEYNMILSRDLSRANDIFINAKLKNATMNIEKFKEQFIQSTDIEYSCLLDYMESLIPEFLKTHRESTVSTYTKTLNKLREFNRHLFFDEIDYAMIDNFDRFMISKKLSQNSRALHHKNLNMFINYSNDRGMGIDSPYKRFKRPRIIGTRNYLSIKDLQVLTDHYRRKTFTPELHNVLEYFLFSCYTGLRFSDIQLASRSNIADNIYRYVPVKSKNRLKVVEIPLNDQAIEIIGNKSGILFSTLSSAATNRSLKVIAASCNINKVLTFHVSRHTFATVFLSLGGKIEVLQKILGHSKLETTMEYTHIMNDDMINQMANFNKI